MSDFQSCLSNPWLEGPAHLPMQEGVIGAEPSSVFKAREDHNVYIPLETTVELSSH